MSDAYYELIDQFASFGERFGATEYVRSAWDPAIQNGAPCSFVRSSAAAHAKVCG